LSTAILTTYNETRKGLLVMWSYKFNLSTEMFMLGFIFVGIGFFMGDGELRPEWLPGALLGYLIWFYATIGLNSMAGGLMEEAQAGTLEQIYMSPTPTFVVFVGRLFATLISSTIMVGLVGTGLLLLLRISIPLNWLGLPVFILTMVGVFGMGYAIAGATLVFKRTGSLTNMLTNVMLFLNGAFLPVDRLPEWLGLVAKGLPTTQGIVVVRRVMLDGQSLGDTWSDGSLVRLALPSAVLLAVGLAVFVYLQGVAKQRGTLGQY
jgi:ABC-2 type transport system permease protein